MELEAKHQLELEELRLEKLQLGLERQLEARYQRLDLLDRILHFHYLLILRFSVVGSLYLSKRKSA